MLIEKTEQIKQNCNNIKSNFMDIGMLLVEIQEKGIYAESFVSFSEFLDSSEFDFSRRHAYRFMELYRKFNNIEYVETIPMRTLLEIAKVRDCDVRESLISQGKEAYRDSDPVRLDKFQKRIERAIPRMNERVSSSDSKEAKIARLLNDLINDIDKFKAIYASFFDKVRKTMSLSDSSKSENIISLRKEAILKLAELKNEIE